MKLKQHYCFLLVLICVNNSFGQVHKSKLVHEVMNVSGIIQRINNNAEQMITDINTNFIQLGLERFDYAKIDTLNSKLYKYIAEKLKYTFSEQQLFEIKLWYCGPAGRTIKDKMIYLKNSTNEFEKVYSNKVKKQLIDELILLGEFEEWHVRFIAETEQFLFKTLFYPILLEDGKSRIEITEYFISSEFFDDIEASKSSADEVFYPEINYHAIYSQLNETELKDYVEFCRTNTGKDFLKITEEGFLKIYDMLDKMIFNHLTS